MYTLAKGIVWSIITIINKYNLTRKTYLILILISPIILKVYLFIFTKRRCLASS